MANVIPFFDLDYHQFVFAVLCTGFALGGLVALLAFGRDR